VPEDDHKPFFSKSGNMPKPKGVDAGPKTGNINSTKDFSKEKI
jgi:hypothetical protein